MLTRSSKVHPSDRLIVALDLPDFYDALRLVSALPTVTYFKVGLEAYAAGFAAELLRELDRRGKRVFVDLKLHDIPETVKRATRALSSSAHFVTAHASRPVMQAAVEGARHGAVRVLAVTVLTSMDCSALIADGYDMDRFLAPRLCQTSDGRLIEASEAVQELVVERAVQAKALGCHGVVASPQEAAAIRAEVGEDFLIVTPGVRLAGADAGDQKRVATPEQAFEAGADYIVVGRPIRDAPDPGAAAEDIQATIARLFR